MGMDEKLKEMEAKIKQMERETIEQIRTIGYWVDSESRSRWIKDIMRIDGVTYYEACRLVVEDPQYSLGWKMCGCPIIDIAMHKKKRDKFREILTPEEDRIFTEEVLALNLKRMVKKQVKKQKT